MYEDLEAVAQLRMGRATDRIAKECSETLVRTGAEFAARGLSRSGPFEAARLKLFLNSAEQICREVANTWRDLIIRKDGKLSQSGIAFIMSKVEESGQSQARNILPASQTGGSGDLPAWAHEQLAHGVHSVVASIRRDLEIERRETELFPSDSTTASREVFVIMAAREELRPLYEEAICPAVRQNGLEPFLMVQREPQASISNEILSRIETAKLILADLTFERPNCYYEVGYAQAKGKKVLFTVRSDHDPRRMNRQLSDPKIHFDLDSHRFSFWEECNWTPLLVELNERIRQAIHGLQTSSTVSDRLSEKGENEVLTYLQGIQSGKPGTLLFYDHFVAQELGWPLDEVRLVLKRLFDKGWIERLAGGYCLKNR